MHKKAQGYLSRLFIDVILSKWGKQQRKRQKREFTRETDKQRRFGEMVGYETK